MTLFAAFFEKEQLFTMDKTGLKIVVGGATIDAPMRVKIFKILENGSKVCAHHFDHLEVS